MIDGDRLADRGAVRQGINQRGAIFPAMTSFGMGRPDTHFARTPKGAVGYQVFGQEGPDLVFITHWLTKWRLFEASEGSLTT